jgi:hypothetical protein
MSFGVSLAKRRGQNKPIIEQWKFWRRFNTPQRNEPEA